MRQHTGPDDWREAHRARWDERVALHTASDYYDQDRFRRVRDVLRDFEIAEVGDVTGRTLLHLQCHFGQGGQVTLCGAKRPRYRKRRRGKLAS